MAGAFTKAEVTFFEDVLTEFQPNNITARQVSLYTPDVKTFERAGQTFNRPMPYISAVETGIDMTGNFRDLTQLSVPSSLSDNDVMNVPFKLSAYEINDPQRRKDKARSAVQKLSAAIDVSVANAVGKRGAQVVTDTAAISTYDQVALCEAQLQSQDVNIAAERCYVADPYSAAKISGNMASRQTVGSEVRGAYERSRMLDIAGFDTFRASFTPTVAAKAGSGVTVSGAQRYIPRATDTDGNNVDNRYMNLTVSATTNVAEGDAFTIAGINALSHINKEDTGKAKTFRVVEVVDGATLKITPAIIVNDGSSTQAEKEYANCSAVAADTAAITFINTVTTKANLFWMKDSVELIHGRFNRDEFKGMPIMTERTDSGIEILFARETTIDDLSTKYRLTLWARGHVLNTEMCGIHLGGQT